MTAGIFKTMKQGASGPDVKAIQKFLNKKFKFKLKEDGKLGPDTERAVMAVQKKLKLRQDGIIGPKTVAMFESVMEGSKPSKKSSGLKGQTKLTKLLKDQTDKTLQEGQSWLKAMEAFKKNLSSVVDDAHLADINLPNSLQKQQQALQLMSNVSKTLYQAEKLAISELAKA